MAIPRFYQETVITNVSRLITYTLQMRGLGILLDYIPKLNLLQFSGDPLT